MQNDKPDPSPLADGPLRGANGLRRRAKIVCTIGPVSNSEEMIRELMLRGMDVARLNFSHGTHEQHAGVIERLRKVAAELGRSVCIMQDLQGPKIRTGRLKSRAPVSLKKGQTVTITPKDVEGTTEVISTTYQNLADDVKAGEHILLSDGKIELVVREVVNGEVACEVLNGGMLGENQGINLPGTNVSIPSLTEKDLRDLEFGLKQGVDLVAISFVRTVHDVVKAKNAIAAHRSDVGSVAKLEKPQAIENLDGILDAAVGGNGSAWRPGRGSCARESSADPEVRDPPCSRLSPPGDHRDTDAGVDDGESAPHPRRGQRRGQRGVRRDRCGDAVRRDRQREVSAGGGGDDGAHCG